MRRPHSLAQRVREGGHTGTVTPPHSLNRPALVVALALAVSQDILYALIFLSFMNHYLLDVLDASPGLPGITRGRMKFRVRAAQSVIRKNSRRLIR